LFAAPRTIFLPTPSSSCRPSAGRSRRAARCEEPAKDDGKGCGKGIFFRALVKLLGQHGMQIFNPEHLVNKFNAHLGDCVAIFAEEAFYAGDVKHEGVLKGLVTELDLPIEPKFKDPSMRRNRLHIIMAANSEWVVLCSKDERRYAVIDVSDRRIGDFGYFQDIVDELEADGGSG
jgi:hypothetical protein